MEIYLSPYRHVFPNIELRPYKEIKSGIFLKIGNKTPAGVSERLPMLMACYVIKSTSYFYSNFFFYFDMFFPLDKLTVHHYYGKYI